MKLTTDQIRMTQCTDVPQWARELVADLCNEVDRLNAVPEGTGKHRKVSA